MKCPNCGFENKPESLFCVKCGTSLSPSQNSVSNTSPNTYCPQYHSFTSSFGKSKRGQSIDLLTLSIGGGIFWLSSTSRN